MNWLILSLPLVASLSLLLATAGLYFTLKESLRKVNVPSVKREEIDISPVLEAFRKVFPQEKGGEIVQSAGVKSTKIKLLGTAVGVRNFALLKVDGKTLVLEEGKEKQGVRLKRVWRKGALLEVGGEELRLRVSPPEPSANEPAPAGSSSEIRISRREVERITRDPGIMFREIRLVPYVKNGKTEGFIFEWVKPGSLFYRAGLRKGDILVSINNMTIKSGEDAFRILQALRNEPSLRVVVLRQGQRREIDVRIE